MSTQSQDFVSYPDHYQGDVRTVKGVDIFIRPLQPDDRELFTTFMRSLSERTVYYRFLSPMREIRDTLITQLLQVDHANDVALAAFKKRDEQEVMVGVSRLYTEKNQLAEISVVVSDTWQGKGIGAELFSRCLEIGRSRGVQKVWGLVLPGNTQMLNLARKLNFKVVREEGSHEYFISIDYNDETNG